MDSGLALGSSGMDGNCKGFHSRTANLVTPLVTMTDFRRAGMSNGVGSISVTRPTAQPPKTQGMDLLLADTCAFGWARCAYTRKFSGHHSTYGVRSCRSVVRSRKRNAPAWFRIATGTTGFWTFLLWCHSTIKALLKTRCIRVDELHCTDGIHERRQGLPIYKIC